MEISFDKEGLMAIAKLANAMIAADGKVAENEMYTWTVEMERLGVPREEFAKIFEASEEMPFSEALRVVTSLNAEQKRYIGAFLGSLMAVDGEIDNDELKLWQLVSTFCDLPTMSVREALTFMSSLD